MSDNDPPKVPSDSGSRYAEPEAKETPATVDPASGSIQLLPAGSAERYEVRRELGRGGMGMSCALPFAVWMGVREWTMVIAVVLLTLASLVFKLLAYRRAAEPVVEVHAYLAFVFNALAVAAIARAWGPLFVMPVLLLVFANGYAITPSEGHRGRVLATSFLVQIAAVIVEVTGLLPRSYAFADGALTILPRGVTHSQTPTLVGLTAFSLFMIFMPMRLSGRLQRVLRKAEERALVNAWQLGQLLPNKARTAPPPSA